jgi:hypothetical protein
MASAIPPPQHLRVFLASPGDVADERALVRHLLKDELPYDPFLRGRVRGAVTKASKSSHIASRGPEQQQAGSC